MCEFVHLQCSYYYEYWLMRVYILHIHLALRAGKKWNA